jgi:hypothetical protein
MSKPLVGGTSMCACKVCIGHCAYLCTGLDMCVLRGVSHVLVCVKSQNKKKEKNFLGRFW